MTKEELLEDIREERPNDVINRVQAFKLNKYGFFDVLVDKEGVFFNTKIRHTVVTIPHPYSEYEKLSDELKKEWSNNQKANRNIFNNKDGSTI